MRRVLGCTAVFLFAYGAVSAQSPEQFDDQTSGFDFRGSSGVLNTARTVNALDGFERSATERIAQKSASDCERTLRPGYEHQYLKGSCDPRGGGDVETPADVEPTTTVTPEPVTIVLLGSGLTAVGAAALRRRRVKPPED